VIEPELVIEKNASAGAGDAGDPITFTITVGHTSESNSAAYDLLITDTLPVEFIPAGFTALIGATDVSSAFQLVGQQFTTTGIVNLEMAETLTITFSGDSRST
jgi:large repetitive protein